VLSHGVENFLLVYEARMYPATWANRWSAAWAEHRLPLELVPSLAGGNLTVRVLWKGKPHSAAEVQADLASQRRIDAVSDAAGEFSAAACEPGTYPFRAKHVERVAGEQYGSKYASIRHYNTLVVTLTGDRSAQVAVRKIAAGIKELNPSQMNSPSPKSPFAQGGSRALPDLPFGVTSFGAAVVDQSVYLCGGHLGPAHEYDFEGQSDRLLRLDLRSPNAWEVVGSVPRRAGLAMVSFGGNAYRTGGFEARNKRGEAADLHSVADFCRFDPATKRWEELPAMPQGRSSHEAIVVGNRLIVVGGWELRGNEPSVWHDSALQVELSLAHPVWEELPKAPFRRRALALGEYKGKVYVLGGMQEHGGPTTTTVILDLATGKWSDGPKLPGEGLEGFGGSAITCAGRLYASTYSGRLWRLSEDGREWQDAGQLARPRFFHRLICSGDDSLVALGGANMEEGKNLGLELVRPSSQK